MKKTAKDGTRYFTSPVLEKAGCGHFFGTRDFGNNHQSSHRTIKGVFPEVRAIARAKQVHGRTALMVEDDRGAKSLRRRHADIVITGTPGIAAAVRTADCTPVLICDPKARVVAAVHAGWKGTGLKAPKMAVETMAEEFGCVPSRMFAAIGPVIGTCHYQVDGPVIEALKEGFGKEAERFLADDEEPGKARLDLSAANKYALMEAGLRSANISELSMCTYCHADLFYSYRRECKGVPSLYHAVWIRPD